MELGKEMEEVVEVMVGGGIEWMGKWGRGEWEMGEGMLVGKGGVVWMGLVEYV